MPVKFLIFDISKGFFEKKRKQSGKSRRKHLTFPSDDCFWNAIQPMSNNQQTAAKELYYE